ncbi:MAG: threonylcarbamoyl-AMP synthase [Spirochaetaceae bacterium]|nr:threonylcarbamoyl-AMP synthase [Myxococcales bacterium]MCB9724701.1 threonylcarbamoyl-AMP synthase [Spirochaetaceae bacterium]HPG26486.1 L-threonylcarbamoyladenylate synthase [Myxococcota bacterium]
MRIRVDPDRPAPRKLAPALEALRRDQVVIYPTDSGYAFGCALSSRKGIQQIRTLKGLDERSRKPLSMLVNDLSDFGRYAVMPTSVFRTIRRILPGPYTIVLEASQDVPRDLRNRDGQIGLRMPDVPLCRMLVELLGEPLVRGSVTPGEVEPELEDPEELERRYRGRVEVVLDGGMLWPEPSTILQASGAGFEVTRVGKGPVPDR